MDFALLDGYTYCQGDWNNCLLVICRSAIWNCCCVSKALGLDAGDLRTAAFKEYGRPDVSRGYGFEACLVSIASMEIMCEE